MSCVSLCFLKREISKAYWSTRTSAGASLHHWLIPQRAAWAPQWLRNGGWNLIELPKFNPFHARLGLNQWMGFARNWGPQHARQAARVENSLRVGIPAVAVGAGVGGYMLGSAINDALDNSIELEDPQAEQP